MQVIILERGRDGLYQNWSTLTGEHFGLHLAPRRQLRQEKLGSDGKGKDEVELNNIYSLSHSDAASGG